MTTITTSRVLVLVLAVLALAVTAPAVSAHGNDTTADPTPDDAPVNGTAADWADWMESHMTDHMGPGAVEWMESHMGFTVEEMAEDMASGDVRGGHMSDGVNQPQNGGMGGHC